MCTTAQSTLRLPAIKIGVSQLFPGATAHCDVTSDCTTPTLRHHRLQQEKHRRAAPLKVLRKHGLFKLERAIAVQAQGLDAKVDKKLQKEISKKSVRKKKSVVVGAAGLVVGRAADISKCSIEGGQPGIEGTSKRRQGSERNPSDALFAKLGPLLSEDVTRGDATDRGKQGELAHQDEGTSTKSVLDHEEFAPSGVVGGQGRAYAEETETEAEAAPLEDDNPLFTGDSRYHACTTQANNGSIDDSSEHERRMRPGDAEADELSDGEESTLETSRALLDDWFDSDSTASISDDEGSSSESFTESSASVHDRVEDGSNSPSTRKARSLQAQINAARQTADNRRSPGARLATSRILEASDFTNSSSGEALHWDENHDLPPSVSIYTKQQRSADPARSGAGARTARKRDRHKAKTHEDHRRRALERKSQLASAGLPLHLEAEDHNQRAEPAPLAHPGSPAAASSTYRGFRCEVCRRLRKGGCGTAEARRGCLKRLLLFPQEEPALLEQEEPEGSHTFLGLPAHARPMIDYLTSLGFSDSDLTRLREKNPSTFRLSVEPVKARVDFLLASGVDLAGLRAMVHKQPSVLRYRIDRVMKPRMEFLKHLGVPEDEIAGVITSHPSLLELSAKNLEPKVRFLTHAVGIPPERVVDLVRRHPQLLEKSIETGLQPKLDYFVKELGVPRDAFAKMVSRHPQLLQYSIPNGIAPRMEYLRSIGLTSEERVACITKFAQLLSLSVDTCLRPKYEYLTTHLGGASRTVVDFPRYFSLSLENRIIPRYHHLCTLDLGSPFPTSLFMWMLRLTDARFALEINKRKHSKQGANNLLPFPGKDVVQARESQESVVAESDRRVEKPVEDHDSHVEALVASLEHIEASAAADASSPFLEMVGTPGRFRRKVTW